MFDTASLKLSLLTLLGWVFSIATKSDVLFAITALAGISTIVYNGIQIYQRLKK